MKILFMLQKLMPYLRLFHYGYLKPKAGQRGQGLVEYALILVLVAVVVIVVLALLGPLINRIFGTITCALNAPQDMMECFETPEPPVTP